MNASSALAPALVFSALLLAPATAAAAPPVTDNFDNFESRQLAGFEDVGYDSGWIPANSPVQLRIEFQAANTVQIEMLGEGLYDWETEQLAFAGNPEGGNFRYDVGLLIHAEVQADVIGFTWGSDLLGPFDYLIEAETDFDPYLLLGSEDRPAVVADSADGATIASIPLLPDIVIASGNLDIDLGFDVQAELFSDSILAEGPVEMNSVVMEDETVPMAADEVEDWMQPLPVDATLFSYVTTSTTIVIRPHLVMEILGTPYDIAGIDIPVMLPEMDEPWVFDTQKLEFERPEPADTGGSGEGTGTDTGDTATGDETGETSDGASLDEVGGDDGCNCVATRKSSPASLAWLLLLLPLRRRRNSHHA